ncbi:tyrosine-type recombinase/integrase [Acinetobacter ursingii]
MYLKQRKLKPLSVNTYNHCINTFLSDWKERPIFEINKKDVFDRFIKLTEYSPTQANLTLKMFGSIWRFAQIHCSTDENPILKQNPVDVIPAKRGWNRAKARTRHLDETNIHTYYNAVLNYYTERSLYEDASKNATRDLVLFIMYTGCRRNEAQTLKWENVDIEKGLFVFKDPKNGDDHLLPMGDHLFEIIKQRYELKNNEYVFPGSSMISKAKHISGAHGLLKTLAEQTGVAISLHDLRRTFATICNNLDYGPYTIKRLLNHRSGAKNDVTGGYVQVSIKKLRLAMNDIEAVYQGRLNCFD